MVEDCRQPRPAIAPRIAFMITGTGVHDRPESAFKINWNARSRSTGFGVHDPPERAGAIRGRYAAAPNRDKRRILEELVAATGYHEKSAIRVLNAPLKPKRRQTRQRASLYDEAARGALIVLWEASDRVCGKRLKALLPVLLPA
jgi:hypothetical protein